MCLGLLVDGNPPASLHQVVVGAARRRHCTQEPQWTSPSVLLDEYEGAGWGLIMSLIKGDKTAQELLANPFVVGIM